MNTFEKIFYFYAQSTKFALQALSLWQTALECILTNLLWYEISLYKPRFGFTFHGHFSCATGIEDTLLGLTFSWTQLMWQVTEFYT